MTKLLIAEQKTPELRTWLTAQIDQDESAATASPGRTWEPSGGRGHGDISQADRARYLLDGLDILPLTEPMMMLAESLGPATLRSLDAIHLAAAAYFEQELTAFVTYDRRLLDGCRDIGLTAASPGST